MKKSAILLSLTTWILSLSLILTSCSKGGGSEPTPPPTNPPGNPPGNPPVKKYTVSTIAGSTVGFLDGAAGTAQFNTPLDVVVLNDGTVFIGDRYNSRIRKLSGGQVTTFAGSDNSSVIDGNGVHAGFESINRIVADANGNLYSTDWDDTRIRKTTPGANVSTFAGSYTGYLDGPALSAQFGENWGIAIDAQNNVYITDTYNSRIRKISGGQVTSIAGDGTSGFANGNGTAAKFYLPQGLVVDDQGNLYVADRGNNRIRKITPAGEVSTFAGTGTQQIKDGIATEARFASLLDLVRDPKGNMYVLDNNTVRLIEPDGKVTTIAGNAQPGYVDGKGADARFRCNFGGLGIDKDGHVYVADDANHVIRKITITTE